MIDKLPLGILSTATSEETTDHQLEEMHRQLKDSDVEALTVCLEEITKVYALAPTLIVSVHLCI